MERIYSLAQLTAIDLNPPQLIALAHKNGYHACGVRLLPVAAGTVAYNLMDDPAMLADTLAAMRNTGVFIADLEIIIINENFKAEDYKKFFEVGQKLGAQNILTACNDINSNRLLDSYSKLCEACSPYGLTADIEFMPWLPINTIKNATKLATQSRQKNAGVLVDTLHFDRSDSTLTDLQNLNPSLIHYAQICDAPKITNPTKEELLFTARCERLAPGDGEINLVDIFKRIPEHALISVEIPHDKNCKAMGYEKWAKTCLEQSKQIINSRH